MTFLLILGWLILGLALLAFLAMICAASWLKCGKCQGWHDSTECDLELIKTNPKGN